MALLTLHELQTNLRSLPGWELQDRTLVKTFDVPSFSHAVVLIGAIAQAAEAADHHPDLNLHGYNKLTVTLSTHSEGGVTIKDVHLAEQIEAIPRRT
jgi:4a-hydroxytetrahydrobiopterin dehydratase